MSEKKNDKTKCYLCMVTTNVDIIENGIPVCKLCARTFLPEKEKSKGKSKEGKKKATEEGKVERDTFFTEEFDMKEYIEQFEGYYSPYLGDD